MKAEKKMEIEDQGKVMQSPSVSFSILFLLLLLLIFCFTFLIRRFCTINSSNSSDT